MLASSMCNAASVEIRGQNFEKNLQARGCSLETQLREWAASTDSSPEGWAVVILESMGNDALKLYYNAPNRESAT